MSLSCADRVKKTRYSAGQHVVSGATSIFSTKDRSLLATGIPISEGKGSDTTFPWVLSGFNSKVWSSMDERSFGGTE